MNDRNGKPIYSTRQNKAANVAVDKLIKRQKEAQERSKQILDYYSNKNEGKRR